MDNHMKVLLKALSRIVFTPAFLALSILGNGLIGLTAWAFLAIESGHNPHVREYIDALWWAFSTATTTGYGDITPVTGAGKVLSIFLMLTGLALFAMYTALFAETIISHSRKSTPAGRKDAK
jgi:voltage-gated potassium channel